jgi:hypothetical protein
MGTGLIVDTGRSVFREKGQGIRGKFYLQPTLDPVPGRSGLRYHRDQARDLE